MHLQHNAKTFDAHVTRAHDLVFRLDVMHASLPSEILKTHFPDGWMRTKRRWSQWNQQLHQCQQATVCPPWQP